MLLLGLTGCAQQVEDDRPTGTQRTELGGSPTELALPAPPPLVHADSTELPLVASVWGEDPDRNGSLSEDRGPALHGPVELQLHTEVAPSSITLTSTDPHTRDEQGEPVEQHSDCHLDPRGEQEHPALCHARPAPEGWAIEVVPGSTELEFVLEVEWQLLDVQDTSQVQRRTASYAFTSAA